MLLNYSTTYIKCIFERFFKYCFKYKYQEASRSKPNKFKRENPLPAKPEETQDRSSQSSVCLYEVLFG